ncbi:MAG: glycosyltransferase family 39 protein, partial [Planctomycetaceae bacterium]|nr:glycosyltransferase family 39 protein [Planctomycetaceae bacterium]
MALLIRLAHLWLLQGSPLSSVLMGDARRYHEWASQVAKGDWLGQESFYQAPLYPYFIGAVYSIFGIEQATVRIAQAILGATSCVFLAMAGRRFFSPKTGLLAGGLFAVYAPAIFFDGILQKTSLSSFLTCGVLALIASLAHRPRRPWVWAGLGFVLGALVLVRENALVLFALMPIWLALGWGTLSRWNRLGWGACLLLGLAVVLFPVALRNRLVGGEWHLTTSQFGPNFYIGNSTYSNGRYMPLRQDRGDPAFERIDATELAEKAEGRSLTPSEVSAFWTKVALDDIQSDWPRWFALMGRKWFLTWNATEIIDTEGIYAHSDASWILRCGLFVWHFGVLAPLGFLGIALAWTSWRRQGMLLLFIGAYAASVSLFYVFARYRFPLVPPLILLAAAGVLRLPGLVRRRPDARLALGLAGLLGMAVWTNWPGEPHDLMRSNTHYMLAINLERDGGQAEAIEREFELAEH